MPVDAHPSLRDPWVEAISAGARSVLACAGPIGKQPRLFSQIPVLALTIDAQRVDDIAGCPGVTGVDLNRQMQPFLSESIPLVGADVAHSTGWTGSGTAIAIIDTGVNYTLSEFGSCTNVGDGGSCRVVYGLDTADGDDDPFDCASHGTIVTAIAAGDFGVAPAADILSYKVFSGACAYASTEVIAAALDDVLAVRDTYGVVSVNMSLGGGAYSSESACRDAETTLTAAIDTLDAAGILVVAAAGNGGESEQVSYPACLSTTVSVANSYDANVGGISWCLNSGCTVQCEDATTAADQINCSSNGGDLIDIAAPGALMDAGGFVSGGTSMAAPHVAGAAALLVEAGASTVPALRAALLESTATVLDDRGAVARSYPRLDVMSSIDSITSSDCHFGSPGSYAYCSAGCPCGDGEGDCDSDAECDSGLSCVNNVGSVYGYAPGIDVCQSDCHSSPIGTGPYCSVECPCDDGEGDCDTDSDCFVDMSCVSNVGAAYGWAPRLDVCQDDCHGGEAGAGNYCSSTCPCGEGEGDCDSNADCTGGTTCVNNVGALYGWPGNIDVCQADCHIGAPGDGAYCSPTCPCDAGFGDCDTNADCSAGLSCSQNVGAGYGYLFTIDVCE